MIASPSSFIAALHAEGPAADRADRMGLYAWLIGRWDMDVIAHGEHGVRPCGRGEIHFGWVLEGRAIQDVWITPPRGAARLEPPPPVAFYGTTLRVYDPGIDAWHILWVDPVNQRYRRQIGRGEAGEIVQHGTDEAGVPVRWRFTDIAPDSFRWLGERSPGGGSAWQTEVEFLARRAGA